MGYPLPSTQSQALLKESKSQRMPEKLNETEVLLKALAVSPSDSGVFCLCHTPHLLAPAELARLDLLLAPRLLQLRLQPLHLRLYLSWQRGPLSQKYHT